jgi:hypothetical protein
MLILSTAGKLLRSFNTSFETHKADTHRPNSKGIKWTWYRETVSIRSSLHGSWQNYWKNFVNVLHWEGASSSKIVWWIWAQINFVIPIKKVRRVKWCYFHICLSGEYVMKQKKNNLLHSCISVMTVLCLTYYLSYACRVRNSKQEHQVCVQQ